MEVLKAIQKAKEVKSKLNNPEKKVGLCVGGGRSSEEPARKELARGRTGPRECSGPPTPGCTPPRLHDLGQVMPCSVLICRMGAVIVPAAWCC